MYDLEEIAKTKGLERLRSAMAGEEPVMLVLRTHLLTENALERILTHKLPRGDRLTDHGGFSYNQKLQIVSALDFVDDSIISSLRNLNKLRNQCAHQLEKSITESDVTRIGSPLGKNFAELRKKAKFDTIQTLEEVLIYICGYIESACFEAEHPDLRDSQGDQPNA